MSHERVFDFRQCSEEDREIAHHYLGTLYTPADLVIAPDGETPYIYRWHIVPRNPNANVYFHVQVADDPERPLHDHPWNNMSVILAGGYHEILNANPPWPAHEQVFRREKGDVIFRSAYTAHRLMMPKDVKYTMTQFSTGPKIRQWGFWYPEGWRPADDDIELVDGISRRKDD